MNSELISIQTNSACVITTYVRAPNWIVLSVIKPHLYPLADQMKLQNPHTTTLFSITVTHCKWCSINYIEFLTFNSARIRCKRCFSIRGKENNYFYSCNYIPLTTITLLVHG